MDCYRSGRCPVLDFAEKRPAGAQSSTFNLRNGNMRQYSSIDPPDAKNGNGRVRIARAAN